MQILNLLVAPTVVFLAVVAPIWIIMHYRSQRQSSRSLTQSDLKLLEDLLVNVDRMSRRIEALEAILAQDDPNWRHYTDSREPSSATNPREMEQ
jgi:phage shock protein B